MIIINKIITILIAGFLLLSNNGISLILNNCIACDAADYYYVATYVSKIQHNHYNADHSFHDISCNNPKENKQEEHDSCGIFAGDNEYCETEIQYLKNNHEALLKKISDKLLQTLSLPVDISSGRICCSKCTIGKPEQNYIEPPPKLVSKTFIIFTNQFKFC